MKRQALTGSALVALGVATASLLAPQAASALDFNFSFGGVEGLFSGLADNTANQIAGVTVSVTNNGGTSAPLGTYSFNSFLGRTGFVVASGSVTESSQWLGLSSPGGTFTPGAWIINFAPSNIPPSSGDLVLLGGDGIGDIQGKPITFTAAGQPPQPVPGPLPLFGAAAAFRFSRKLRDRINVTRTTAPTRPAG